MLDLARSPELLGQEARWIASAPGRVNLIGEHVDYNDGFVLPAAIDLRVTIAAAPNGQAIARLRSLNQPEPAEIPLDREAAVSAPAWSNYARGVIAGFQRLGLEIPGFDAVIESTIPSGGGLSSSAALEVSMATLLEAITGRRLPFRDKALLCQQAEHEFAGVPCGIMDQFASVFGQEGCFLLLDCRSQEVRAVRFERHDVSLLVFDTKVRHALADGAYARRRRSCEEAAKLLGVPSLREATLDQVVAAREALGGERFRRARHVVTEIARTQEAVAALEEGDLPRLGALMAASHASLRDDYEVSCAELDLAVELAAAEPGVIGCRMTGGGFGGCAIALVRNDGVEPLRARLLASYQERAGLQANAFITRPSAGARVDLAPT